MRLLILLLSFHSITTAMMFVGGNQGGPKKFVEGDWPARFPQHPAGFDYKCKNRKFGTVTLPPQAPIQKIQLDVAGEDVVTTPTPAPTTPITTVKLISTTLKQILTSPTTTTVKKEVPLETGTTFWIRSPTPPNTPASVVKGGAAFTVGPPQFATVKIDAPHAPDAAIDSFGVQSGDLDFDFKTVGTPKAPRKVIDPDA